jgi:hypothetical protein
LSTNYNRDIHITSILYFISLNTCSEKKGEEEEEEEKKK